MVFVRKRFYIWLIKAYFKKWRKVIIISLFLGPLFFAALTLFFNALISPALQRKTQVIGFAGSYSFNDLPEAVLNDMSFGLTKIRKNGTIEKAAAGSWEIKNGGHVYIFHLNRHLYFHNGIQFTADTAGLDFKDVKREKIDTYTVKYTLKSPYAPFLSTVSKPIFNNVFSGLGPYKLINADINAGFINSLVLEKVSDHSEKKIIHFYPTQDSLKIAFALGDINRIEDLFDLQIQKTNLVSWKNAKIHRITDYTTLLTLFYNVNDRQLSDKKLRQALTFALPNAFAQGRFADSPIDPNSIYYEKFENYSVRGSDIAKTLLSQTDAGQKPIALEIKTTPEYRQTADEIAASWKKIGVKTRITIVDTIPNDFQIFLFPFTVPRDPDQYTLWHSDQINNIAGYKNLRIDKLLEDGRKTMNEQDRIKIYVDFQKYLLDDAPASFLYFPYKYTVVRTFP